MHRDWLDIGNCQCENQRKPSGRSWPRSRGFATARRCCPGAVDEQGARIFVAAFGNVQKSKFASVDILSVYDR